MNFEFYSGYGHQNRWEEPSYHQRDGPFPQRGPPQHEQFHRGPRNAWDECNDLFQQRQDEGAGKKNFDIY